MSPRARSSGLLLREIGDETLVYDLVRHEAHCLNAPAAFVFRHCDGRTTVAQIARRIGEELSCPDRAEWVETALRGLDRAGLLETSTAVPTVPATGRRALLRGVGAGAALLLPAVVSMVAPTPAEAAASCVDNCSGELDFTPCDCLDTTPPCAYQCQTGVCVGSPGGPC